MNSFPKKLKSKFRLAELASEQSEYEIKVGAVIYKGSIPVSIGWNNRKTHPIFANGDNSFAIHAEISAVLKSKRDLTGCSIFVFRKLKNGLGLAKPCKECMKILISENIRHVYFTTYDGYGKISLY